MSHLKRLEAMLLEERADLHRRKCLVCRKGQKVLAAIAEFRKAKAKDPEKWAGVGWATLLRWADAAKYGINYNLIRRHFDAVDPAAIKEVMGG